MQDNNDTFLKQLEVSSIGEKVKADIAADRIKRRRNAIAHRRKIMAAEAEFLVSLSGAQKEVEGRKKSYEQAEEALRAAGSALYLSNIEVERICAERGRMESEAVVQIGATSNPRANELLFEPIRKEMDMFRSRRIETEIEYHPTKLTHFYQKLVTQHKSSTPSILARKEFFARSNNHVTAFLLDLENDDDATLIRIKEAIFKVAPLERPVTIPLERDGMAKAKDRELLAAVALADDLAERRFNLASKE
jgi:hypothetical protein